MKKKRLSAILATVIGICTLHNVQAEDRGAEYFGGFCNFCHGDKGQGIQGLEAPLIAGLPAWYVEAQLKKFRSDLRGTHPKDMPGMRMRPIANTLQEYDIPTISKYVENMPIQKPTSQLKDADLKKGEAEFAMCAGCHGADAEGNKDLGAPLLAGQDGWYLLTQLRNFKSGVRGADPKDATGAQMRPMAAALSDDSMKNIAAYLQSLSRK